TAQHDLLRTGETDAQREVSGRAFLDIDVDVDLVGRTRHGRGLDGDFLEEAEALDARARLADQLGIVPAAFHLRDLSTDHLVPGADVATDVEAAHIHAPTRIDEDGERHFTLLGIHLGRRIDVGKGIALVTQTIGDGIGGFGQFGARKDLARPDGGELEVFLFGQDQVAGKTDGRNGVHLTLGDVHRDV